MRLFMRGALAGTALLIFAAGPASAHEGREINGKYHFAVGWGDEPAYTGFKNSVQLLLTDANDKPIDDLGDTLKVEVSTGDQKTSLSFEPDFEIGEFGTPGDYRAWLVPTRPGTYTFHITGTIKNDQIDQTFTSGDKTFDDIKTVNDAEFPAKDPSNGDLASRLQRAETRATRAAKDAKDSASTARTLAIVGIALGAVGLVAGVTRGRRK